jgi:hypothetical protein
MGSGNSRKLGHPVADGSALPPVSPKIMCSKCSRIVEPGPMPSCCPSCGSIVFHYPDVRASVPPVSQEEYQKMREQRDRAREIAKKRIESEAALERIAGRNCVKVGSGSGLQPSHKPTVLCSDDPCPVCEARAALRVGPPPGRKVLEDCGNCDTPSYCQSAGTCRQWLLGRR